MPDDLSTAYPVLTVPSRVQLVGFIAHANPQIRLAATENLVPYSTSEPEVFKSEGLQPIKNLKLLIKDHPKIAEHVLTMLVNLSGDPDVLTELAKDEKFLEVLLSYMIQPEEPNADVQAMLLANISGDDSFLSVLDRTQKAPAELGSDERIINQLMDLFVKGQDGGYNKNANFDYLAYVFANLSKHERVREYFASPQDYDGVVPLTKIKVFTEHKSDVRRKGVASTIKNTAFDVKSHPSFLSESGVNILPYILLPITGNEEYDVDEALAMLPDLQLLPPDKRRDPDAANVRTHVETLTLLTTTREGRDLMREVKVYPVVRETHARVNDEAVREACDRLVQVLMRDEEGEGKTEAEILAEMGENPRVKEIEADEDDEIVEV
ncbi:DNA-binding protein hgh1 protein [Purpureocillium lavendulum]|uniref:Protein HGH1 homolog n=1 Tax=Purpureocillium lavendulum TaxID=1247861 RepID=A0AB34G6S1_9HYPO|nr:DNA-binding protein hgh1 protein [Purpureocillium lavendulum]